MLHNNVFVVIWQKLLMKQKPSYKAKILRRINQEATKLLTDVLTRCSIPPQGNND